MPRPSVFAALRQLRGPMLLRVFRILNFTFSNMAFFFDCSRIGNFLEFSVTHFSLWQDDVKLVNYLIAIRDDGSLRRSIVYRKRYKIRNSL